MKKQYFKTIGSTLIVGAFLFLAFGSGKSNSSSVSSSSSSSSSKRKEKSEFYYDCNKHKTWFMNGECHKCFAEKAVEPMRDRARKF
jgi:hypothetical protein